MSYSFQRPDDPMLHASVHAVSDHCALKPLGACFIGTVFPIQQTFLMSLVWLSCHVHVVTKTYAQYLTLIQPH